LLRHLAWLHLLSAHLARLHLLVLSDDVGNPALRRHLALHALLTLHSLLGSQLLLELQQLLQQWVLDLLLCELIGLLLLLEPLLQQL
jgi:hypothetical protein